MRTRTRWLPSSTQRVPDALRAMGVLTLALFGKHRTAWRCGEGKGGRQR